VSDIRIVSDGTREGTKVLNAEGREMSMVTSVNWHLDAAGGPTTAIVTFVNVPVDVVGKQGEV
jgi:hypothetical protein